VSHRCFESIKTIAKHCCFGERRVRTALKTLRAKGFLDWVVRKTKVGQTSNLYSEICHPALAQRHSVPAAPKADLQTIPLEANGKSPTARGADRSERGFAGNSRGENGKSPTAFRPTVLILLRKEIYKRKEMERSSEQVRQIQCLFLLSLRFRKRVPQLLTNQA
jgi:hypothetical protein